MKLFKWIKFFSITLMLSTILIVALTAAFLSTNFGKEVLKNKLNAHFQSSDFELEINNIDSFYPLLLEVKKVVITEEEQDFLSIENLSMDVNIKDLILHQTLKADLKIKAIKLLKQPSKKTEASTDVREDIKTFFSNLDAYQQNWLPLNLDLNLKFDSFIFSDETGQHDIQFKSQNFKIVYLKTNNHLNIDIDLDIEDQGKFRKVTLNSQGDLNELIVKINAYDASSNQGELIFLLDAHLNYNQAEKILDAKLHSELKSLEKISSLFHQQLLGSGSIDILGKYYINHAFQINLKSKIAFNNLKHQSFNFDTFSFDSDINKGEGTIKLSAKNLDSEVGLSGKIGLSDERNKIKIEKFFLKNNETLVSLDNPMIITQKDNTILLEKTGIKFMDQRLFINGALKEGSFDFYTKGQVDLAPLSKLIILTEDIVRGKVDLDIHLSGTKSEPELVGTLILKNGYYENAEYGTIIDKISMQLDLNHEMIKIVSSSASDGEKGHLTLSGSYNIKNKTPDVKISLKNFIATNIENMSILISDADLNISSKSDLYHVLGDIYLGSSKYNLNWDTSDEIKTLNVVSKNDKDAEIPKPSLLDQLHINLKIHISESFLVEGKGLRSRWRGNLLIESQNHTPLLNGELNLIRGNLKFLGKTLNIEEGKIIFDRHPDNTPLIDILSSIKAKNIKVNVQISGRATKPAITISSDPSLPQDEILARLLFDKDTSSLSPMEALNLASAISGLANLSSTAGVNQKISNFLNLDKISIGQSEAGETELSVEKRVFDKVTIDLSQGIDTGQISTVIEFEITPSISLKTENSMESESQELSLNYNHHYN